MKTSSSSCSCHCISVIVGILVLFNIWVPIIHANVFLPLPSFLSKTTTATHHHHHSLTESEKDLCHYIQSILCTRLELVLNQTRATQFSRSYKKRCDSIDGEYTTQPTAKISSFHGRQHSDTMIDDEKKTMTKKRKTTETKNKTPSTDDAECQPHTIPTTTRTAHSTNNIDTAKSTSTTLSTAATTSSSSSSSSIFPTDITSLQLIIPSHLQQGSTSTRHPHTPFLSSSSSSSSEPSLFQLCTRAMVLAFHFTPILYTCPIAYCSSWFRNEIWYSIIARTISKCGPAFIKWGQWASTRPDMFPDPLCVALSHLHSNAPQHSWKITQDTVEEALQIPKGHLLSIFSSFEAQSIASGSIAQVHRATLWNQQEEQAPILVAVKVRHPQVELLMSMDFRIMSFIARIIDSIPSLAWLQLRPSIEQFSHTMAAQAHLHIEAHHLEVLNYNFKSWDDVSFPQPFFACNSVILETFERGSTCSTILDYYDDIANMRTKSNNHAFNVDMAESNHLQVTLLEENNNPQDRSLLGYTVIPKPFAKFIVSTGVSVYLKMLLVDNLMHADLHPGNLMLDTFFYSRAHKNQASMSWKRHKDISPHSLILLGERETHQPALRSSATIGKLPTKDGEFYGHVTLVDAGMVAQLDEVESSNFVGLLVAIGEGDGRAAAEVVLNFSSSPHLLKSTEREIFIQDMVSFFATSCRGYYTNIDFSQVLRGILGILKKHRVRIDANYATLAVNLMCVDSLARRVSPSYNCLDAAKPLLRCYKFLFQDSNGRLSLRAKSKWRQGLLQLMIPIMQARKKLSDDRFFRELSHTATRNHVSLL